MKVYFVSGNQFGFCACAGHWLADSPREAIAEFKASAGRNPFNALDLDSLDWKARASKTDPRNTMNARPSAFSGD